MHCSCFLFYPRDYDYAFLRFFLCRDEKSSVITFFTFLPKRTKEEEKKKRKDQNSFWGSYTKSNASQIEYYVVVKGRRGRESAHGVSSETLSGLRVLVRGARGRDSRVCCGRQRRARLLFRGEKCKGKEEDVKET